MIALASVAEAIWCYTDHVWFRNSYYQQKQTSHGRYWDPQHSFPPLLTVNPEYSGQTWAQKPDWAPYVLDTPNLTGKHTLPPLKNPIDSWPLSRSFHVMIEISHSGNERIGGFWHQKNLAATSSLRKPTQREPSHSSGWLSDTSQYSSEHPEDIPTMSRIDSQKIWKLDYAQITRNNFPSHCHEALPQSHLLTSLGAFGNSYFQFASLLLLFIIYFFNI